MDQAQGDFSLTEYREYTKEIYFDNNDDTNSKNTTATLKTSLQTSLKRTLKVIVDVQLPNRI